VEEEVDREEEEEEEALGLEIPQPATTPRELGRGDGRATWEERGQSSYIFLNK